MIPVAARRAFVAAFAATGGIWIAQAMQAPHGHWAAITALALVSPGADGTLRKTVFRIFGTVLAALTVIGLFGVADPQPEWIIGGSLVMLAGAFILGPHSPAPYAVLIWLLYFVLLLDAATSIFSLLCVVFVVIWGCGLLLSSRTLAYLGVQIGLVFSWSIGDSLEASPDVWIALVRTAQVGLATAVFLAVQPFGWPRGFVSTRVDARRADAAEGAPS